jgi:NDP-sugar pyrophosphorylase family protein
MRPATDVRPKPLLEVAGMPFVVHQLGWLASQGVTDVVYSIGYRGQQIRDEVARHAAVADLVRFVDEGEAQLGTGGAVRYAVDEARLDGAFFVLYGDSFLQIDLAAVAAAFSASGAEALMTVFRNDGAWDRSNADFDGRWVRRYDKDAPDPAAAGLRYIDYGLSILKSGTVTARIAAGRPADLAEVFRALSGAGELAGYEARHRFYEIGSPRGLADLEHHLAAKPPP